MPALTPRSSAWPRSAVSILLLSLKRLVFVIILASPWSYIYSSQLEGLMSFYEERNHINDLMTLLEAGLGLERAHKVRMFYRLLHFFFFLFFLPIIPFQISFIPPLPPLQALFTELAVFYCRHRPDKLMEHLKLFWSRMNIPKVGGGV